jgi:hypothetical protein
MRRSLDRRPTNCSCRSFVKRVEDKVKDIVDVRAFPHVDDLAADPAQTVAGYYFTDVTSDLFAKWVHLIAGLRPETGVACALAGYRGVGKSHFLELLGSLLEHGELRGRVKDEHARSALGQLSRRHYTVIRIRRGTGPTLLDEFQSAIISSLKIDAPSLGNVVDLLRVIGQSGGDAIILIDTAQGRETRVSRDDGATLSEIAIAARSLGMFVGVALDDDISGADGPNSVISKTFLIDYLDQEHLYKILDRFVFPKNESKRAALHAVYEDIRKEFPAFRWSEQRFSAIYPLHPATLEIAPIIRLYLQDFGLLRFASQAGLKVPGRPANSLICLDEVFDTIEQRLRKAPELQEAFSAYTAVEKSVIDKAPVIQRLQAKLVLKVLFLLSLHGRAFNADAIASTMLLSAHKGSIDDLRSLLASFAAADQRICVHGQGPDAGYQLDLGKGSSTNLFLDEAAATIDDDTVWRTLVDLTVEKFSDAGAREIVNDGRTMCLISWRGALRRGEIKWRIEDGDLVANPDVDWQVVVDHLQRATPKIGENLFVWRPAALTADESETLRRHTALQRDPGLRERLGTAASTTIQLHALATERVWERVFLSQAILLAGDDALPMAGFESVHTLSQLFSELLAKIFDSRYPDHPVLGAVLGPRETSKLVADFFGCQDVRGLETQNLAEQIALPLGLAVREDTYFRPAVVQELAEVPFIGDLLAEDIAGYTLAELASRLRNSSFGLSRDAQRMVFAALVAQREFEFVTSTGSRITHRSLDLQLLWDDVVGLARSAPHDYSSDRLVRWAALISGSDLGKARERGVVTRVLAEWLETWRSQAVLEQFDALRDDALSVGIWKTAHRLKASFGLTADVVGRLVAGEISETDCLTRIADTFLDSDEEHEKRCDDLEELKTSLMTVAAKRQIESYLVRSHLTDDSNVETARMRLARCLRSFPSASMDVIQQAWTEYYAQYVDHYSESHRGRQLEGIAEGLEEVRSSELWSTYRLCSALPIFDRSAVFNISSLIRNLQKKACPADISAMLTTQPFCDCEAHLLEDDPDAALITELRETLIEAISSFRRSVQADAEVLKIASDPLPEAVRDHLEAVLDRVSNETFHINAREALALKTAFEAAGEALGSVGKPVAVTTQVEETIS